MDNDLKKFLEWLKLAKEYHLDQRDANEKDRDVAIRHDAKSEILQEVVDKFYSLVDID